LRVGDQDVNPVPIRQLFPDQPNIVRAAEPLERVDENHVGIDPLGPEIGQHPGKGWTLLDEAARSRIVAVVRDMSPVMPQTTQGPINLVKLLIG
jgi:hypothetical protein